MIQSIIFDFNRTLYDPETQSLVTNAELVLESLFEKGYELFLISFSPPGTDRDQLIKKMEIDIYFKTILTTKNKSIEDFEYLISDNEINTESAAVIGDRVRSEIKIGNQLGLKTIWVRDGKFRDELPNCKEEVPDLVVNQLVEIIRVL